MSTAGARMFSRSISDWFEPEGLLSQKLDGFRSRKEQLELAKQIAAAIDEQQVLVAEAGTGVGKTYAYLVPALLSGKRVILSTGTRHLQDQLFHRDLPAIQQATGRPVKIALLKGRANYLCLHRLDLAREEATETSRRDIALLDRVAQWSEQTNSGDLVDLLVVSEDSPLRPRITSTAENCLGSECPVFNDCFVMKARRKAQESDIVVVNHHLLLADMVLKETGFAELLPGADAVVVDEAHQFPELAVQYFGQTISSRQIANIAHDVRAEAMQAGITDPELQQYTSRLEKNAADLRIAFGDAQIRKDWREFANRRDVQSSLEALQAAMDEFAEYLKNCSDESRGLENCLERITVLRSRMEMFVAPADSQVVRWLETTRQHFLLHATPVEPREKLAAQIYSRPTSWIFTSATLSVDGSMDHFVQRIGLDEPMVALQGSPFDFENNALLYVPDGLPPAGSDEYTGAVVKLAMPLIRAAKGRTFLLFTSHRALRLAAELLDGQTEYPILVQGDMPRSHLLDAFREHGNAILLGTSSFWEGVDVRGAALSLVIIDKLPFASPDDPVLQARLSMVRTAGGNPFMEIQVPQAVIGLKQGAGRLIRDVDDRGVMVICDDRLYTKSYGKVFLASLPPMTVTRDPQLVLRFLNELE